MTIWKPELLNPELPKYKALAEIISNAIEKGNLTPGEQLPTHRALADNLGVTVGTVTRAYAEAEKQLLIESKVGSGIFVRGELKSSFQINAADEQFDKKTIDLSFSFPLNLDQPDQLASTLSQLSLSKKLLKQLLDYQTPYGLPHHQEASQRWMELTGIHSNNNQQLLITNGGQHGFSCVTASQCRAGDTVLSAGLTYPGFIQLTQQMGLRHIGLATDEFGIVPDALRVTCQRYQPRLIYVNSRVNNPSCEQMTQQRIDELAEILYQYKVQVVEDDIQGCLLKGSAPTFFNSHPDITSLVTGTSKAIAGGLRVGYLSPAKNTERSAAAAIRASCCMPAPLMVEIASRWIMDSTAQTIIQHQLTELKIRHRLLDNLLQGHNHNRIDQGLNVWLTLPESRRAEEFCQSLKLQNVLVKPSSAFAVGHFNAPQAVRFCVGGSNSREALMKAVTIINNELSQPATEFDYGH